MRKRKCSHEEVQVYPGHGNNENVYIKNKSEGYDRRNIIERIYRPIYRKRKNQTK